MALSNFVHINFSKKGEQIWMNLRWFTVKHKCLENNFPKITCTSKSVRGLKTCYIVLYFLFCLSCLLYILDNQKKKNQNFLKQIQEINCCGTEHSFISRGQCYTKHCLSFSVQLHSHTLPHPKKGTFFSASDGVSIGGEKKLFNQSQSEGKQLFSSVLITVNTHILPFAVTFLYLLMILLQLFKTLDTRV